MNDKNNSTGAVAYEPVLLDKEHHNVKTGGVSGLVVDGITVRVDDIYFSEPEQEGNDVEMCIEYKLVSGIPENIDEFESNLAAVMIQITNEYNSQKSDNEGG